MTPCAQFDPLLAELASGPIEGADAVRLDAHLAGCPRCRQELAAWQRTLGLARLPEPSDAERRPLDSLPARALGELRRDRVGTPIWRAFAAGFAAAAAIAVVIAAPTAVREPVPADHAAPAVASAWAPPDPDELLAAVSAEDDATWAGDDLIPAELLADAAYARTFAGEE